MSEVTLEKELRSLVQLFFDATYTYEKQLEAAGDQTLADEWRYNVGDLLRDIEGIGGDLTKTYSVPSSEMLPAMRRFLFEVIYGAEIHTRGHITRLQDILAGELPSWPEGEIESDSGSGLGACSIELWRVMGEVRRATDDYVAQLKAAGMGELAEQWKDALRTMTWEAWSSGEFLVSAYIPPNDLPGLIRWFFRKTHEAEANCRGPMARLKDAVK